MTMTEAQGVDLINLLFYVGCLIAFGLGAIKGGQR